MSKSTYDFLNIITYVSLIFFIAIYNQFMTGVQIWIMMLISLFLFLIMTSLMLYNATRMNVEQGISDVAINSVIFFLGT